jgi:uncharacterized protein (DUF427 family)
MWKYTGQRRPDFALDPQPGQESVWDYPRPPALLADTRTVEVRHGERLIARSTRAVRVCETASPPTFYLPPDDIDFEQLVAASGSSYCEWKGQARYWALRDLPAGQPVGWSYPDPLPAFRAIRDWLCFYPGRVDCFVAGEAVKPQLSEFYGGWITAEVVGPFKGDPGTSGW